MRVRDFLKKLQARADEINEGRAFPPAVLKESVGIACQAEAITRLKNRRVGLLEDPAAQWRFKGELHAYGQALVGVLGIAQIERWAFDRVADGVIEEHNRRVRASQEARDAKKRAARDPGEPREFVAKNLDRPVFSLGEVLGA